MEGYQSINQKSESKNSLIHTVGEALKSDKILSLLLLASIVSNFIPGVSPIVNTVIWIVSFAQGVANLFKKTPMQTADGQEATSVQRKEYIAQIKKFRHADDYQIFQPAQKISEQQVRVQLDIVIKKMALQQEIEQIKTQAAQEAQYHALSSNIERSNQLAVPQMRNQLHTLEQEFAALTNDPSATAATIAQTHYQIQSLKKFLDYAYDEANRHLGTEAVNPVYQQKIHEIEQKIEDYAAQQIPMQQGQNGPELLSDEQKKDLLTAALSVEESQRDIFIAQQPISPEICASLHESLLLTVMFEDKKFYDPTELTPEELDTATLQRGDKTLVGDERSKMLEALKMPIYDKNGTVLTGLKRVEAIEKAMEYQDFVTSSNKFYRPPQALSIEELEIALHSSKIVIHELYADGQYRLLEGDEKQQVIKETLEQMRQGYINTRLFDAPKEISIAEYESFNRSKAAYFLVSAWGLVNLIIGSIASSVPFLSALMSTGHGVLGLTALSRLEILAPLFISLNLPDIGHRVQEEFSLQNIKHRFQQLADFINGFNYYQNVNKSLQTIRDEYRDKITHAQSEPDGNKVAQLQQELANALKNKQAELLQQNKLRVREHAIRSSVALLEGIGFDSVDINKYFKRYENLKDHQIYGKALEQVPVIGMAVSLLSMAYFGVKTLRDIAAAALYLIVDNKYERARHAQKALDHGGQFFGNFISIFDNLKNNLKKLPGLGRTGAFQIVSALISLYDGLSTIKNMMQKREEIPLRCFERANNIAQHLRPESKERAEILPPSSSETKPLVESAKRPNDYLAILKRQP